MTNHPFESTGMVTDPGKVKRDLKLVSDYAKKQNIPTEAAIKDLENRDLDLSTFKAVLPTTKKTDTFLDYMKKRGGLSVGIPLQIGGAEYYEQEYDPKLGRLVGKNRPKNLLGGVASLTDALTLNLLDTDQKGGGFLGIGKKSLRGFGGQPKDFELPTTVKKLLEEELDYAEGITGSAAETKQAVDAIVEANERLNPLMRKNRLFDVGLEMAAQRAQLPFITNQMKDLSTFKQRQLLDAEKIKQSFPNAIQSRLLTADTGFKTQADAIANQTDAATRFAQAGTGIKFG
tara:strand:- start:12 stop:875 length:864 start_codon:yes stop_codon:yes gene_type:complete